MTKEELIARLKDIEFSREYGDAGVQHRAADAALIEYINDDEVKNAYDEIGKWYE